jgi:hypothetical protein
VPVSLPDSYQTPHSWLEDRLSDVSDALAKSAVASAFAPSGPMPLPPNLQERQSEGQLDAVAKSGKFSIFGQTYDKLVSEALTATPAASAFVPSEPSLLPERSSDVSDALTKI